MITVQELSCPSMIVAFISAGGLKIALIFKKECLLNLTAKAFSNMLLSLVETITTNTAMIWM
jgi:hypothetical protein